MDVLIALVAAAGQVVAQPELIARAWPNVVVGDGSLRVTIAELRKALGDGQDGVRYITNVTGRGYCFVAPVERTIASTALPEPPVTPRSTQHRLPPRLARMVGRNETVRSLAEHLISRRFVSIVGPGGMGKTTVAIALAHHLVREFPDTAYFVDFGTLADSRLVTSMVAAELGLSVQSQDAMPSVIAFLTPRRGLLVLDNCEHVIDVASALAEQIYNEAPRVHILTTSREALRVEGEHVYLISPLDYPVGKSGLTAADAMASPAVQLFMDRAFASGHVSPLKDAEAPIVAAICGRLDGLALAIELAASRVGAYGLQGTADLLSNRFKLLWQGRRTAPPRHQTLQAMLDWSFNLLSVRDRCVLTRLSAFVGVFTLAAAQAVVTDGKIEAMDVAEAIASLVGKSLISVCESEGVPGYRLLDSTSAFATEKLAGLDEANDVALRHAQYFSDWCANVAPGKFREQGQGALPATEPHLGNIRAALEWAFSDSGDLDIAVGLAAAAVPLFFEISFLAECRRWCEAGLAAVDATHAGDRTRLVFQATLSAAAMFTLGNGADVLKSIEVSLALAQSLNDKLHEMHLLAGLNIFHTRVGDFKEAVVVAKRSMRIAEDLGSVEAKATGEWMLGVSYHLAGDQALARFHCERGLALAVPLDPAQVMFFGYNQRVRALVALARSLWLGGFPDQAAATAQLAVDEANMQSHPVILCMALIYAINVFLWNGSFERAGALIDKLIDHASTHALGPYHNAGLALSGDLAVRRGDVAGGLPVLKRALGLLQLEKYNTLSPLIHAGIVTGLMRSGEESEASVFLELASDRPYATTKCIFAPELLRLRGELCRKTDGDDAAAETAFQLAIHTARSQSALSFELKSAMSLAGLWSSTGKRQAAVNLLQDVYGRFTEGFETADLRHARHLLEDLGDAPKVPEPQN